MNEKAPFARFEKQGTVLLTTFRRDGRPVRTPVSLALVDGHAVFRTWDTAWKARRLAHTDRITLAPSTAKGRPTGPVLRATARRIAGEEAVAAAHALRRKHPILHGVLVPLAHRVRGYTTIHFRVDLFRRIGSMKAGQAIAIAANRLHGRDVMRPTASAR